MKLHYHPAAGSTLALLAVLVSLEVHGLARIIYNDFDGDGVPDVFDACPTSALSNCGWDIDYDNDSVSDLIDNCPAAPNISQEDSDGDGIGDACDPDLADTDGDGVRDLDDNCPLAANPGQTDADEDGIGDVCDSEVGPIPDLVIAARGPAERIWSRAGTVEFVITNNGPAAAENVVVEVDLADYMAARSYGSPPRAGGDGWDCELAFGTTISTCTRSSIGPAGSADSTVVLRAPTSGVTDTTSNPVLYAADVTAGDNLPDGNHAEIGIQFLPPQVDLVARAQQPEPPTLANGAVSRYFFGGLNLGPQSDNNLLATFSITGPAEFVDVRYRFVRDDGTEGGGLCSENGTTADCGRVFAPAGRTVEYTLDVAGTADTGAVSIEAEVHSNATDIDTGNNVATIAVPALTRPLLNQVQFVEAPAQSEDDLAISPDGLHLYKIDVDADGIWIFSRDPATGMLSAAGNAADNDPGSWQRQIEVSDDGNHLYLVKVPRSAETDPSLRSVRTYARDAGTGALTLAQTLLLNDLGISPDSSARTDIVVSHDDAQVYVVADNRLLVFSRNYTDGSLTLLQTLSDASYLNLALGATGTLFASAAETSEVLSYARDGGTGVLSLTTRMSRDHGVDTLWPTGLIRGSRNGANLYVTDDNFPAGGQVSVLHPAEPGEGEDQWWLDYRWPTWLNGIEETRDGRYVLVAGEDRTSSPHRYFISVSEQEPACGELDLREAYAENVGSTGSLYAPWYLLESPDRNHLYAVANGIMVFTIDSDRDGMVNSVDPDTSTPPPGVCPPDQDTDGDGVPNANDDFPLDDRESVDTDLDDVGDNADNCIDVANTGQDDNDLDALGDACDADDDNDGVLDIDDDLPFDPFESLDTDGDGTGNNADPDDDDDAVPDVTDNCPLVANTAQTDTDGDGDGDGCDTDDDGDGVPDSTDAFPLDPTETRDTDRDGIGNNADPDDDNDGTSDADEIAAGTNPLVNETVIRAVITILFSDDHDE